MLYIDCNKRTTQIDRIAKLCTCILCKLMSQKVCLLETDSIFGIHIYVGDERNLGRDISTVPSPQ